MSNKYRSTTPALSGILQQTPKAERASVLGFVVSQTLEQSGLSLQKRAEVFKELEPSIQGFSGVKKRTSNIVSKFEELGMRKALSKQAQWLYSEGGQKFLQQQIPEMKQVGITPSMIPSAVQWSGLNQKFGGNQALIDTLHQNMATQMNIDKSLIDLSYSGGQESRFKVHGMGEQVSRVHELNFKIQSEGISFKLPLLQPSKEGFMVQTRDTVSKGFTKGQSVFMTAGSFFTDLQYDKINQKYSMGGVYKGKGAFWNFQMSQLQQFTDRVQQIRSNAALNPAEKQNKIGSLVSAFKQTQERSQFFVGSATEVQGAFSSSGVGQYNQNYMSKTAIQSQIGIFESSLGQLKGVNDPRIVIGLMREQGVEYSLSGGQTQKLSGFTGGSYTLGIERLSHYEPTKALSELTPTLAGRGRTIQGTVTPRIVDMYRSAATGESMVKGPMEKIFKPVGVQAVGTLIPSSNEAIRRGSSEISKHLGNVELVTPDGSILATEKLYKSGALDVSYAKSYGIKITGPGSASGGLFTGTVGAIMGGGQVTGRGVDSQGKGILQSYTLPGLTSVPKDVQGEARFFAAVGVKDAQQFQQRFPGGIPLNKGEHLGFDVGSGRSVTSLDDINIRERIVGIGPGGSADEAKIVVARRVSAVTEQHKIEGTGSVKKTVPHQMKVVSEMAIREGRAIKGQIDMATEKQTANILQHIGGLGDDVAKDLSSKVEIMYHADTMKGPASRLFHMSGAVKYELATGRAKAAQQEGTKNAIKRIAELTNQDLLKGISSASKNIVQDLEAITTLSKPETARMLQILAEQGTHTMDQKVAATSMILFGGLPEEAKMKALGNVFAPYTEYGREMGLHSWGQNAPKETVERYFNWGGKARAQTMDAAHAEAWRTGKQMRGELDVINNELVNARGKAGVYSTSGASGSEILSQKNPFVFYTSFSPRDESRLLGTGGRATLEPRFFDIALATPELHAPFREITKRTTDFRPVINKLSQVLEGTAPRGLDVLSLTEALGQAGRDQIGLRDLSVDLGLSDDVLTEAQSKLNQLKPGLKGTVRSQLFLPGGEDIAGMGRMVSGAGVEKDKTVREVFSNYMKSVSSAKQFAASEQSSMIARSTASFYEGIQNVFKEQVVGVAGGQTKGMMRTEVKGSAYLLGIGPGMDFLETVGILPTTQEYTGKQQRLVDNFKTNFIKTMESGESVGRQFIASEASIHKMYGEAIASAKSDGDKKLIENLNKQYKRLQEGGSVLSLASRHPGIGIKSATPARMWMDVASSRSASQHYVRGGHEFVEVLKTNLMQSPKPIQELFQTAIAADLAGDLDGDRYNLFVMAQEDSQRSLRALMKTEHQHAMKYQMIKDVAKESITYHAQQARGIAPLNLLNESTQGALTKMEESAILAQAAPGQVVPKMSNTFTEMKFAVSRSSIADSTKANVYRFLEAAEQVPIGSKHLMKSADYSLEVAGQMQRMKALMFTNAETRVQAIDSFMEIFAAKNVREKISYDIVGKAAQGVKADVDYMGIRNGMIQATNEMESHKEGEKILKFLRRKTSGVQLSVDELPQLFRNEYKNYLSKIYGHDISEQTARPTMQKLTQAAQSRSALGAINESIQSAGRNAKAALPTQGIVGLAASAAAAMLVAGAAGVAMGPTWTDSGSGGQYADPDNLFPDELEYRNAFLHGASMPTPISGHLATPSYQATIHMPPGSHSPGTLGGRLGSIASSQFGGAAHLHMQDHRSSLDALTLARIKNEII